MGIMSSTNTPYGATGLGRPDLTGATVSMVGTNEYGAPLHIVWGKNGNILARGTEEDLIRTIGAPSAWFSRV